ncbi:MAG: two-component system phosphate regulon sensor histidine kinase PhoR [Arenicella sp.]|jgi:two-component system phosphate regulon sensor histidine kinase PhoR
MRGVLAVSVLIFFFVFGLLFFSIKSLITQNKIADLKTDFVNNITHKFKTPLATLSLATKMLRKQAEKEMSAPSQETANVIERQSKRLQNLTDQVLKNTLHYQQIKLKKENVAVGEYLSTLLNDFSISANNTFIVRQLETEGKTVLLDKFYFTTAILNLLENAVKYNGRGVEIFVSANIEENLTVSIQDNGIGISEKNQEHLFEKFFRVGNQKIHNVKGLGLGLYYTSQIIKAHGGEISVRSKENEGAIFTVKIPIG